MLLYSVNKVTPQTMRIFFAGNKIPVASGTLVGFRWPIHCYSKPGFARCDILPLQLLDIASPQTQIKPEYEQHAQVDRRRVTFIDEETETCSFVSCSDCFGLCVLDKLLSHASHAAVDPSSIRLPSRILIIVFSMEYRVHSVPGDSHSLVACFRARKAKRCFAVVWPVRFRLDAKVLKIVPCCSINRRTGDRQDGVGCGGNLL